MTSDAIFDAIVCLMPVFVSLVTASEDIYFMLMLVLTLMSLVKTRPRSQALSSPGPGKLKSLGSRLVKTSFCASPSVVLRSRTTGSLTNFPVNRYQLAPSLLNVASQNLDSGRSREVHRRIRARLHQRPHQKTREWHSNRAFLASVRN